jgi:hypothetical protein
MHSRPTDRDIRRPQPWYVRRRLAAPTRRRNAVERVVFILVSCRERTRYYTIALWLWANAPQFGRRPGGPQDVVDGGNGLNSGFGQAALVHRLEPARHHP